MSLADVESMPTTDSVRRPNIDLSRSTSNFLNTIRGIKIDVPPFMINLEHPSNQSGKSLFTSTVWTGSEYEKRLLNSNEAVLIEVQDISNLVLNNENVFSNDEVHPKILIPMKMAREIGFSKLTQLGSLTEHKDSNTFVMSQFKEDTSDEDNDSIILHMNNQKFRIKYNTSINQRPNFKPDDFTGSIWKWSLVPEILKSSFFKMFSPKIIIGSLVVRYLLSFVINDYDYIIKTWFVNKSSTNYFNSSMRRFNFYREL